MSKTRIAIHGAAGRMGQRLVALAAQDKQLRLVAALEAPGHPQLGTDAGEVAGAGVLGLPLTAELPGELDVVVDFSVPQAAVAITRQCAEQGVALVLATTGLSETQPTEVRAAAAKIPLLWAPNMSLAVNLAMKLAEVAAAVLKDQPGETDVEIIEWHHRHKEDAPSGTALHFGQIISAAMGQTKQAHGRQGRPGPRPGEEIGYHAIRAGDNPGEHTVLFGLPGETLEIRVAATSRDAYAQGALAAARWLVGKKPGLYSMADVLNLGRRRSEVGG